MSVLGRISGAAALLPRAGRAGLANGVPLSSLSSRSLVSLVTHSRSPLHSLRMLGATRPLQFKLLSATSPLNMPSSFLPSSSSSSSSSALSSLGFGFHSGSGGHQAGSKQSSSATAPPPKDAKPAPAVRAPRKKRRLFRKLFWLLLVGLVADIMYLRSIAQNDETWLLLFMEQLPFRAASRVWGNVNKLELPLSFRAPLYNLWARLFDCNLEEMSEPLESYRNLNEFFTRALKPGVRPLGSAELVSPVDGRVMAWGEIENHTTIQQVKGQTYEVEGLLGFKPTLQDPENNKLFYSVIYLWPGDYHRMHAPANFSIKRRFHVAGELFSVSPYLTQLVPGLFCRNERLILEGQWKHGFFSYVPVGAYNVGSIRISYPQDAEYRTNLHHHFTRVPPQLYAPEATVTTPPASPSYTARRPLPPHYSVKQYEEDVVLQRGDEVAVFELGSTVVLVFEAPKSFRFRVPAGERVKMGQNFGTIN